MKNYRIDSIISNKEVTIKYDQPIITELKIINNKPDMVVIDNARKKIIII